MASDIVRQNATVLTVNQLSAVAALAAGSNVTDAATVAKVDRSTLYRWMAEQPEFVAALNCAKQKALDSIRSEVRIGAAEAIKVVRELMNFPGAGNAIRLKAATVLLQAVGALSPEPIGSTDPADIKAAMKREEFNRSLSNLLG